MNDQMQNGMAEATRLTQQGRLDEATAAIQRALGGAFAPAANMIPIGKSRPPYESLRWFSGSAHLRERKDRRRSHVDGYPANAKASVIEMKLHPTSAIRTLRLDSVDVVPYQESR